MYRIEAAGTHPHVTSDAPLTSEEFYRLAGALGFAPLKARKTGRVSAERATMRQRIETRWNGKESEAVAQPGDWIVTSLAADGQPLRDQEGSLNTYVIEAGRFAELYVPDEGYAASDAVYRPKGEVLALRVQGGFDIEAPWGEKQRAVDGWLLLNGSEVYGNHRDTFAATYEIVG
ncbi:MAG: hypothetical protein AB7O57_12490 [Hyphomicrobiaceae bacterium]